MPLSVDQTALNVATNTDITQATGEFGWNSVKRRLRIKSHLD
jgi:hypothetical protein